MGSHRLENFRNAADELHENTKNIYAPSEVCSVQLYFEKIIHEIILSIYSRLYIHILENIYSRLAIH